MNLKITAIRERGVLDKERIVLKATAPTDVGKYILLVADAPDGAITNSVKKTFWFPDKMIAEGDFIVLYTKKGRDSEKGFKGATSHFFYFGETNTIWDDVTNIRPVLLHAPEWESFESKSG